MYPAPVLLSSSVQFTLRQRSVALLNVLFAMQHFVSLLEYRVVAPRNTGFVFKVPMGVDTHRSILFFTDTYQGDEK